MNQGSDIGGPSAKHWAGAWNLQRQGSAVDSVFSLPYSSDSTFLKVGILTTHPIQYQAPWFRALSTRVEIDVFFAHQPDAHQQGEGFGKAFEWDVDLLSGYKQRFLTNVAKDPSSSKYGGCDTPEIASIIRGGTPKDTNESPQAYPLPSDGSGLKCEGGKRARFDAFIVCGWHVKAYWQAVRACRKARIPVLVRGDSQLATPRSLLKRCVKFLIYRFSLAQFDGFLSVGQRNREYLLHYGVPEHRIFFVPHFVDNEWFGAKAEALRSQRAELRKQWNIPEHAFCILFCGKFIPKKRPMDVIEAVKQASSDSPLPASRSPLHLLFVGSGELGTQLRSACNVVFDAEAASLPAPRSQLPAATFAGFLNQTEMPRAYVAADILVLPSDGGETWGLVVNEAMSCGLPTIVSDAVGCGPDLIDKGTGYTFPLGNVDILAARLSQISNSLLDKNDFALALKKKLETYNLRTAVTGTLEAVDTVVARRNAQAQSTRQGAPLASERCL